MPRTILSLPYTLEDMERLVVSTVCRYVLNTNLAAIVYICKSTLCLSSSRNTLSEQINCRPKSVLRHLRNQ